MAILKLLHIEGAMNVNDIAGKLKQPQSTVSSNMQVLVEAGLVRTETQKARKGNQKICHSLFDEVLVMFKEDIRPLRAKAIEVAMPLGLYTSCEVSAPCGLCSADGIIGLLDVPDTFLDPDRMKAGLIWFTRGYVEYQFPNNARLSQHKITSMEFAMELSSEVPGTSADWPSDITVGVNGKDIGTWTSPGDFGDKRGVFCAVRHDIVQVVGRDHFVDRRSQKKTGPPRLTQRIHSQARILQIQGAGGDV